MFVNAPRSRRRQDGQSTVEFMLMIPVLFAMLFFVIEMGLYFTTVHYGTYAAFATARAQQGGFSTRYPSVGAVSDAILTGAVWLPGSASALNINGRTAGVAVKMTDFEGKVPFPFIKSLLPDLKFETKVYLGPDEKPYEGVEERWSYLYDNNLK